MKKILVIINILLFLIIVVIGCTIYLILKSDEQINNEEEIKGITEDYQKPTEKYIEYVYGIIGELDRRFTVSANVAYDYQDGKLTKEEALEKIGENVLYTINAHDTYVPYDISSLSPSDQLLAKKMEVVTEQLLDLYFEIQLYIQNVIDDEVYLDPSEFPLTIGMEVTDLIEELNGYQDQVLDR